ncbi:unnamed protein product [Adineta steineri]|uniref:Carrier domain-containing protein n=1 Tax=Adineta steineri TaxID=433720 RepID=A0A815XFS0_9BILA|nr:unnamed protein product [Adineta steineri]CAF1556948.1 unnamed protein product [Adineta steineri]
MSTLMETALLQKIQEQEMMPSPASSAILASGCSQGAASFAQERIWLDEKIHHDPTTSPAMHNFILPLVIKHGSMPIERIRSAVVAVLEQHEILRTAIYFDENRKMLVQAVQSMVNHGAYSFEITANDIHSSDEIADLLRNESIKHFAELEQGEMKPIAKTNDSILSLYTEQPWLHGNGIASHDMNLKMIHNHLSQTTYCILECSADCYDEVTVANIGRYFQNLLLHIFIENTKTIGFDPFLEKIGNLSLLPMNVETLSNVIESLRHFSEIKPASYAQQQIWLDEERRLYLDGPQLATYNMVFCYRLSTDQTLSVQQLCYALHLVVDKHQSLRTALIFDTTKNILTQRIIDQQNHKNNRFSVVESIYETDEQLDEIIHNETHNPHIFDLAQGLVFRCHIVRYKQVSTNDLISDNDIIIFNFHHASFDISSMKIFLHDLHQAYTTSQLLNDSSTNSLRYLDYAVIEQHMPMIGASMFWHDALHDCKLDQSLSLPYDRYRLTNEYRSGFATSISFDLDHDLRDTFLHYASSQNISLEHLALSMYFVFLFKLTNGETDLCIGMKVDSRYRDELKSVTGMFVNAIPLRCQLDPQWFPHKLVKHVQEILTNSRKYSYFPLRRLLDQHPRASKSTSLNTLSEFMQYSLQDLGKDVIIGDSYLSVMLISNKTTEDNIMNKFDFILSIQHDFDMNQLSCTINASLDLFNRDTVETISQRFHSILHQLSVSMVDNQMSKPIYELSLTLSNEQYLMQSVNNTQISFSSPLICIHHKFVYQVMKHPQKLAVELDEQSLTYCELLYYVQMLSLTLLNEYHVFPGEIVSQCVERSLEMVIGIMAIEMAGGVYCPLSPRDPQHRLHALIEQTQCRLVLADHSTMLKFSSEIVLCNIDLIWTINHINGSIILDRLSDIVLTADNIAYIVFTSGSTGASKGVQIRHRNFLACIDSLVRLNLFPNKGTLIQMASCSFDVHVEEIIGALITSSTIIMLHPQGNMDLDYMTKTLNGKQVSYLSLVPSYANILLEFLESHNISSFTSLCIVAIGGEASTVQLIDKLYTYLPQDSFVWNGYGPSEITVDSTIYVIGRNINMTSIPMGRPLLNYRCMIMSEYLQSSVRGEEGELFLGGVGVFAGYLGRDDLTAKALLEIDGQLFYRTGDLVSTDNNGILHYQGRKDHQIKLHGQRIELGEIERCLLNSTSISACVVMKWKDDHLVAYVQSPNINEEELRQHCQSHLPPHMVPSVFIILDKLPLNPNGKVDRKQLPSPQFSLSTLLSSDQSDTPLNQFEERILTIWCQVLHSNQKHISGTTSFFSVGGHSLLFIELYHHYQSVFNFDAHSLSIAPFLQQPTIFQHSQLLQTVLMNNVKATQWYTLHINEGIASFAQERIFLDEQVRFSSDIAIYNEVSTLQVVQGSLSLDRLLQAFRYILHKHKILHTSLVFNNDNGILKQCITDIHKTFKITMNQTFQNDNELRDIIYQTTINPNLFDLSTGDVFHAEILKYQISLNENENNNNGFITNSDVLLIAFHHVAFDRASSSIFFSDLCLAYNTNATSIEDDESLQYIDYSIHERLIDMTTSREFWYSQLEGFNLKRRLPLPIDHHCLSNDQRSGFASVTQISFDNEISQSFLDYASTHHVTTFQLGLTILYTFLSKLTHGENDLCVSCLNANRHKTELQKIMGIFVSTLPYRIQLDSQWSFDEVTKHVREKCLSILEHSHYPLQRILRDIHLNQSTVPFLQTVFDFITVSSVNDQFTFDDAGLQPISLKQFSEVAKFDIKLTFVYNAISDDNKLSCCLTCSRDLFDNKTITKMIERFQYLFEQLFSANSNVNQTDLVVSPIAKLTLILPDEVNEMQHVAFYRQPIVTNEGMSYSYLSHIYNTVIDITPASFAQARVWLDEHTRFNSNPSQVAIYNTCFVYRLHSGYTLSVKQLSRALQLVVTKHETLRTSLIFHKEKNLLRQQIIDLNDNNNVLFPFFKSVFETDEQINNIVYDEQQNTQHFDISQGLVFRCHFVYCKEISANDLLSDKDVIIFNFYHASFDFSSMNIFLHDLNQAYTTGQLSYDDNTTLRYLDYAVIEQQMSMTGASMFWLDALHDCKLDQPLPLPFDRYRLTNEHRTCHTTSISFDFDPNLLQYFLSYSSFNGISFQHLTFAIYFIFFFKLTNGEKDLCIGMTVDNRYRDEFKSIIGLFENIIPVRCQLDPQWSFHKLLVYVQELVTKSMKYSYFPLQRILDQHSNISNPAFLNTSFEFISTTIKDDNQLSLLPFLPKITGNERMSIFDFIASFQHNMDVDALSCTISASLDLFNVETINKVSQQFHSMLNQLFTSVDDRMNKSIYEISLTLPNEKLLMQSMNNTQVLFHSGTCIHHEFVYQVMKHPQKLAVELDEQSLTYCELLYYVQVLSLTLLNEYHVLPSDIVCQCVERSLSMVIGILSIAMVGSAYCPLSLRDPPQRLQALVNQTQSRLVLVHGSTPAVLSPDNLTLNIDSVIRFEERSSAINLNELSNIAVTPESVVFVIFTSGSTGIPKAVQLRHRNFTEFMHSFVNIDVLTKSDIIIQMARCSFDNHLLSLVGTLVVGATLIMLRPEGNMDLEYLASVLHQKQITVMHAVPSLLNSLFEFLRIRKRTSAMKYLRSLCSGGEAVSVKQVSLFHSLLGEQCRIRNHYGPAEITINCACYLIDLSKSQTSISIGQLLPNYQCLILDAFSQSVRIGDEGALLVRGVGIFAGYFNRDDLTAKAMIIINGAMYYRTGDLVSTDNNGILHYQGRKDHQIKLHGQRIELGEIERCLLNSTSISACVVMKWKDDHLVAYVQSPNINEEELRQHCQSHLPPHMVPSVFIILDKLPLNPNGKVDRKQLPSPQFSLSTLLSSDQSDTPLNQFEERILTIWCQVLHSNQKHISGTTSFFSVGGHSLLFIELYHHYQSVFNFDAHSLSIAPFLQQPTIFQHSQLLQTVLMNNVKATQWYTLHINEGIASFAQERIFLDEQVRFSSDIAIYNEVSTLQVVQGSLSLDRLLQAFRYILHKHKILHTSLVFNNDNGILKQCITDIHKTFKITMNQTFQNDNELRDIIYQTTINPNLFDLSTGDVFHAEILKYQISLNENENNNNGFITNSDVLLIAFHHVAFDRASSSIFFSDLCLAYNTNATSIEDDESLQYIDYSIHERLIDMTTSREFWYSQLEGFNLKRRLPLPIDHHCLSNDQRSGFASVTQISFDNEISQSFLDYASTHHVTTFQLGLTILYTFLSKLTHGENDLCVSCLNANRHKTELQKIMGIFVSTLPYRIQLDSQWSFDEVTKHVREKCLSILEHSHYPLQRILRDIHLNQSTVPFLQTVFDFITVSSVNDQFTFDDAGLQPISLKQFSEVAKFDIKLTFVYNAISDDNKLSCCLTCSRDLFDNKTITKMIERFQYLFEQLFSANSNVNQTDLVVSPIAKLTLILPDEVNEMQHVAFYRQPIVTNEGMSYSYLSHIYNTVIDITPASFAQARVWLDEHTRFNSNPSQVAIYNTCFVYRLHSGYTLSVKQLSRALQLVVTKHETLRTSLIFHKEKNLLRQQIIDLNDNNNVLFPFFKSVFETDEQINNIVYDEQQNTQHFDISQGLVFRCHFVYCKEISANDLLSDKDVIIFNFYHASFDFSSMNIFLHDLNQAYTTGQLSYDDNTTLRYLDYAVIEQQMSMTGASMFWLDALHDCKLDQPLPLPFDRYRLTNEHRTCHTTSISFDFDPNLLQYFLSYSSFNGISFQHLTFAIYFIFFFKLTNGEKDLCIGMTVDNRYRDEFKSIIGLFENIIPVRCQLDPQWSFHKLLVYVQELVTKSMKYSYFPLQRILDQHSNISNPAFLNTSFEFISTTIKDDNQLSLLPFLPKITGNERMSIFDFIASFQHNMDVDALSCTISASLDLFNVETINKVSQQFHSMLNQLFTSVDDRMNKSIYEISLTLPNEKLLMQSMNNTQVLFHSGTCIHHEFVYQVMKHPQKLAVELDEQSLTYCELLYYVQVLSLTLLNEYHVLPSDIVCQCVERSLSMVIGILSIAMVGSAYCPLSLRDPPQRLQALVNQTQSRLVLVHGSTPAVLSPDNLTLNIDSVIRFEERSSAINLNELSNIAVTPESVVFVIFTSGSTGIPKAVQLRHRNFTEFMHSFVNIDVLTKSDIIIQMARCSFDNHLLSLVGTLVVGATLIMLRPEGNMDLEYLASVLHQKQITVMHAVPSLLNSLFEFLRIRKRTSAMKYLRSLCSGGEAVSVKQVSLFHSLLGEQCRIRNHYGPAEITINCACYLIDLSKSQTSISIGQLLPNYQCLILDAFSQSVRIGDEGALLVRGVGIFAGYFNRDDLTAKAMIIINGAMYYRTGDLVSTDNNGILHYQGRKDHQIKLHGQRIELGEIERCLLNSTSISACVVMKWNDDYLVAYVQSSSHNNEEQLRQSCQSHLPPHMIPSIFIILDKLPLNPNGKVDRKLLPPPHFSSTNLTNSIELLSPTNDIQVTIHHIWCEIFKQNQISTDTNIFTIGGHSLLMMQLFHRYKIEFHLETDTLSISNLFQHPTIIHHAQLIYQTINTTENINAYHWSSLHLIQARVSFAQERIYLDEQIRFSSNKTTMKNMYVIPLLYRIASMNDHILITRLHHAFQSIITKHNILRTALYLDDTNSKIMQYCLDTNTLLNDDHMKSYGLTIVNLHNDDHRHMNEVIEGILNQADLFDLSKGCVIRCHILRHSQYFRDNVSYENDDLLSENDHILISIHHAMFDGASTSIFLRDLSLAYQSHDSLSMDDNSFEYIDYSVHEHIMDMSLSREFWHSQLQRYNMECSLSLPMDRQRSSTSQQRSGSASTAEITFDNELCTSFLNYASSHHLTLFQLGLSIFYVFLFKLTHGENDLCISSINANRYRSELVNMIGMFVSTLPYRLEIDPHWSFDEVVKHVQEKCLSILEHSHYPLQRILGDNGLNQSNVSFLEIMFDFITVSKDMGYLSLNDANLEQVSLEQSAEVVKFDFSLTFVYNSSPDDNQLSFSFVCSHDLFEKSTISKMAQRFEYMFEQLFQTQSSNIPVMNVSSSINKVCLILPEETEETELVVFHRLKSIVNEAPASFAQTHLYLNEHIHFISNKSEVTIYNMSFVYHLHSHHTLSVPHLRHALQLIVSKHKSLRTSLIFNTHNNRLMQQIIDRNQNSNTLFSFIESTYTTHEQLNHIIYEEKYNPQLFNLAQGLVFRCHIIYYKQISSNHLLSHKDVLIFNFHHALFDFSSINLFLHDLTQAYTTGQLLYDDNILLRYLDYAVIEQQMSMTGASMFWLDALHDCKLDQPLSLPYDRYRLSNEHRTGRGTSISFDFDQDLSHDFLIHASSNNISLEHLTFAIYFIFLFKLTNEQTDLCIAMNINNNRYRDELKSVIGLFENVIPLRCQLDPHWCFHQVLEHVQEITTNSTKYSYFPLQHILDQHTHISKHAFLDTSLEFISYKSNNDNNAIMIGDSQLVPRFLSLNINEDEIQSVCDFSLSLYHDMNMNQLSCTINASFDLFNRETVEKISQRFHSILYQVSPSIIDSQINKPIYELSLTLSNEQYLMQSMNNTQISFPSPLACIHHEFVYQVMKHPQKLAVELDEQSLSYCELLYYVQVLSLTLLNEYHVIPGEIVCQCVERSLSMIIGLLSIETIGGVYCPLSPENPEQRLQNLVEQTQARLILVHSLTNRIFKNNFIAYDIDTAININDKITNDDLYQLSNISITPDDISYIVFTSGSTGIPKAVQVRHRNLTAYMQSVAKMTTLKKSDNVIQMASCSFDTHFQDTFVTLMIGAGLVMLHPHGNKDLTYLIHELMDKDVTFMDAVPSYLDALCQHLEIQNATECLKKLRTLCSGGDVLTNQIMSRLKKYVSVPSSASSSGGCQLWNVYGPAEATITTTYFQIGFDFDCDKQLMSIGKLLPNYQCAIMDEYFQFVVVNQEGELFVGGACVFAGYFDRGDLTAKILVEINNDIFYQSGDLVRYDHQGFLYFKGRKDHQVKLRGQRIELAEIERCLMNISLLVSACTVIKWNDDYLVAYVQSSHVNEGRLRQHCQSHLPPHMIPSIFIILDKLPLNQNGKVDRKLLPLPDLSSSSGNHDDNVPRNTLEQQLQDIYSQAFHIESPHVEIPFGQLGGTSLSAILALSLIRQQVSNKLDIGLLFANPSIRQLAQAIEPLLVIEELQETASTVNEVHETNVRLTPSIVIESLGIALLVCQWLCPIMIIHQWCPLLFPILPICHLLSYVICSRLLSPRNIKGGNIFSWSYYRWWFLDRLWDNNTFWLQHMLGTSLYSYYLRLCGARISLNTHIYTTTIDAPWLLDIGDGTWIADKTTLNCLYYNDNNNFTLHSIKIGCYCSISARSILFGEVDMQDNIIVQPMSSFTGFIESRTIIDGDEHKSVSSGISITQSNRSFSIWHKIYQVVTVISLICIHCTLLAMVYKVYSVEQIPLPISIAFCWTSWSIVACFVTLFLLKFVVGSCTAGETYPIASWSYLHKVWLRQLIVSSFHHAWLLPSGYDYLYPFILRWLGAQVEDDVQLANIDIFLSYPTNLLKLEAGVTSFGYVLLVPTEMTLEGDHRVDCITLGSHTNLGNFCSILPGSHLASHTMVGNLTRITRETNSNNGDIFIGVPARAMPFQMPIREAMDNQIKTIPFWMTCFSHYISKCLLIGIYWSCGLIGGLILHTIIVCSLYRWYLYADNKIIKQITGKLEEDHRIFVCSFLGNTQWLIRLFRAYGANIGNNVILPDFSSIFDYDLVTIGDNVRLNINAIIVCHTFEQRILKLVPVTVGNSCVLMSGSIVMPGCKLMGNNRLYPFTLVMKNDLLQPNTQWKGLPAQSYVPKSILSRSVPVCDDIVKCQQKSNNVDRLSLWYEKISSIYTNVNELQFMNWGYADLDEHIDDNTGYYSKKLYQQVLANITLTDKNIFEVGCGRGAGAAWCVRTYTPRSYVGIDLSRDVINLCEELYSTITGLSFMIADPKTHLPFQNESMDVVLSIETTNLFDEIVAVKKFVDEITRVLTPNGYFLWCGLCNVDGSSLLIDYLSANNTFIIKEKVNITRNVLHALDIQNNSCADFIDRYIQPADQESFHLLAGLPGTQLYDNMQEGRAEYWRIVFRKKTTTNMPII